MTCRESPTILSMVPPWRMTIWQVPSRYVVEQRDQPCRLGSLHHCREAFQVGEQERQLPNFAAETKLRRVVLELMDHAGRQVLAECRSDLLPLALGPAVVGVGEQREDGHGTDRRQRRVEQLGVHKEAVQARAPRKTENGNKSDQAGARTDPRHQDDQHATNHQGQHEFGTECECGLLQQLVVEDRVDQLGVDFDPRHRL